MECFLGAGNCIAWRRTGGCDPDGLREPENDKDCFTTIYNSWSGYCECADGSKQMKKGCKVGHFATCNDACDPGGKNGNS